MSFPVAVGEVGAPTGVTVRQSTLVGAGFVAAILAIWLVAGVTDYRVGVFALTALGFLGAVIGLRNARVGFVAVAMLCALDPLMGWAVFTGGILRWNTFNYWLILVAMLWAPLLLRRGGGPLRMAQLCLLLLGIGLIYSPDRARGVQDILGFASVLGLTTYCARVRLSRDDWYWIGVICGSMAVVGGLLFLMRQSSLPHLNPNAWAFLPLTGLFAVCIALPCSFHRPRGPAVLSALAACCATLAFLSGSRGAVLIAAVCGTYLIAALRGLRRRTVFLGATALIVVATASQFTRMQHAATERVLLLFDPGTKLADRTSHRSDLALGGWAIFRKSPMGVGTGGYTQALGKLGPRDGVSMASRYRRFEAHAGWIKTMAENGVPGLLLTAGFFASFAVAGIRSRSRDLLRLGVFAFVTLSVSFVFTEYQNKAIWFLAAASIAMLGPTSPLRASQRPEP